VEQNIRALKVIVIVLGVVIVLGLGALVVGIARQASRGGEAGPVAATFALPAGAEVLEMDLDGDRLAIRFRANGVQSIQLFDARTGKPVSTVTLAP
jgi:hypothetical protein